MVILLFENRLNLNFPQMRSAPPRCFRSRGHVYSLGPVEGIETVLESFRLPR